MNLQPDWFEDQQGQSKVMDFMDIDQVVEVPDTPERFITSRNNNDGNSSGNKSDGSGSCQVIDKNNFNEKLRNESREKGKSVNTIGSRRLFVRPDDCSNSSGFMLGNSSSSKNILPKVDNVHHEKVKTFFKSNVERSTRQENTSFVDLTKQNGVLGSANAHPSKKHMFSVQGFPSVDALDTSNKSFRLNNTVKLSQRFDRGKGVTVGAQHKAESNSSSLANMSPRVNRHKRLVRNGCISPHNIAKSKQVADKHDTGKVAKDLRVDGSSNTVNIKDLIAEPKDSQRFKGKGVSHHPSFSEDRDARNKHIPQWSSVGYKEETDASKGLSVDPSTCLNESEGWVTTHNTMRKVNPHLVDGDQHISRGKPASSSAIDLQKDGLVQRDNKKKSMSSNIYNHFEDLEIVPTQRVSDPPDTMSRRAHNLGQFKERAQLTKRPHFDGSDVTSSSLSGEPSTSRSTRNKNCHGAGTSDPVISLDELYPENGNRGLSTGRSSNEDPGVRALQVEADEMLARELQEQLYNEELTSAFENDEMDSHLALATAMQQENSSHAIRAGGRPASRGSSVSNLYQISRSNASRNPLNNRSVRAQDSTSTRFARLRGRFPGRSRSLSSTTTSRNSIFPANMDVDMRMHILEALEAFDDMAFPNNDFLRIGREFNENDYEMLLALDDNNHQHGGATHAQINNLPQSTVQAENLQECAICLETPTIGETIRHLPCLHRFHKDCIDQWLKRKTSCPICKSSVT